MDNTIIDCFETVEKQVKGYSESNVDSTILGASRKDHEFKHLRGKKINKKQAIEKGQDLFNIKDKQDLTATKSGEGADVSLFSVSYNNGDKNAYLDVTEKGGHPLTLLVDRPINDRIISLHDGLTKAEEYVREFEFADIGRASCR